MGTSWRPLVYYVSDDAPPEFHHADGRGRRALTMMDCALAAKARAHDRHTGAWAAESNDDMRCGVGTADIVCIEGGTNYMAVVEYAYARGKPIFIDVGVGLGDRARAMSVETVEKMRQPFDFAGVPFLAARWTDADAYLSSIRISFPDAPSSVDHELGVAALPEDGDLA
jgi:hypothetical protein